MDVHPHFVHRPVPGGLPPIPAHLLAGFEHRQLAKGFLLATPGSGRDQVFVVHSGRLRVYLVGESRELSLSFLEPGDIYTTHTPTYVDALALLLKVEEECC